MRAQLFTLFALVILSVWALAFVVSAVTRNWTAFGICTPVLLAAAGAVFKALTPPPERNGDG